MFEPEIPREIPRGGPCGKAAYPDKRTAESAANGIARCAGDRMHAYRCDKCDAWHIGHRPTDARHGHKSPGRRIQTRRRWR